MMLEAFYPLIADEDVGMRLVVARDRAVRLAQRELSLSPMSYVTSFVAHPVFTKPSGLHVRGPLSPSAGFTQWRHSLNMPFFAVVVGSSAKDTFSIACHELKHVDQYIHGKRWWNVGLLERDAEAFAESMVKKYGGQHVAA